MQFYDKLLNHLFWCPIVWPCSYFSVAYVYLCIYILTTPLQGFPFNSIQEIKETYTCSYCMQIITINQHELCPFFLIHEAMRNAIRSIDPKLYSSLQTRDTRLNGIDELMQLMLESTHVSIFHGLVLYFVAFDIHLKQLYIHLKQLFTSGSVNLGD